MMRSTFAELGKRSIDCARSSAVIGMCLVSASLLIGCGSGGTTAPAPPAQVSIQAGNNQQAPVGNTVGIPPAVLVTDQNGHPVPDISVTFAVASGAGSITAGSIPTNSSGVATVGTWKLGPALGTNTLTATVAASGIAGNPVTFTATGTGCNNCWRNVASMPTARSLLAVAQVNGILYAVGGHISSNIGGVLPTVEAYDPSTDTWTTKAPMPTARASLGVTVVNGVLYAIGGYSDAGSVSTVEAYDPSTNTWTTKAPMPTARDGLASAAIGGIIYAVGGQGGGQAFVTVEAYDPATNSWSTKDSMQIARNALGATAANSILYAIGGSHAVQGDVVAVEAYDPVTNSWTTKTSMPSPRGGLGVTAVNGIVYAIGGRMYALGNVYIVATVEAYDPVADGWTTVAPLLAARADLATTTINGLIYAVGGVSPTTGTTAVYQP